MVTGHLQQQPKTDEITLRDVSLDDKYSLGTARAYLTGIDALVRLPILQHQRDQERGLNTAGFVSGYRGSPLGGVDQAMWSAKTYLDKHNIHFVPGVNEDLAATAVRGSQEVGLMAGSQYDGVFGMWYGKGPGLDRSIDAFRHANAAGTAMHGGVLAVVGDDHGCKSSTYPYQSEHLFMSMSMPVLAPSNVQEVLDLGIYGWELSRYCGCWVGLKAITENMDSAISAEIDPGRVSIRLPKDFEMPEGGVNVRWPDSPLEQEERLNKYKIYAALAFARENELNKIVIDTPTPKLGIITSGKSYLDVLQAFDDLGLDEELASKIGVRVYKVGMPWPLEPVKTHEFATGLDEILVVEEKRSVMEDQLTGQLYNWPVDERPRVIGEYDENGKELLTNLSELTPAMIARVIAKRLKRFYSSDVIDQRVDFINQKERRLSQPREVSERKATFCSGCPHNTSTEVPKGSIAAGGIGCHYMSTWSKSRPAHNYTHMGGEGVTWVGMSPFTTTKHIFQNLGDGTYFHSGILAIRQAVAAKANITYKILYNDAVAMTGGQQVDGSLTVPELVMQLKGEGIKRIEIVAEQPKLHTRLKDSIVSVSHRDKLIEVQESMRETKGTSVLIFDQVCATEKRRRRKRGTMAVSPKKAFINDLVCEGCGDCSAKSNCLSIVPKESEFGRKRKIDQASCNQDLSCVKGFCPSFVTVTGGQLKRPEAKKPSQIELPEPIQPALDQPWNVLVTGVGGTGVLTVTAVLSMAAHLEFKGVATMNQTGLAQKFGPVASHLRIAKQQHEIHAVRIPAGDADLVLGADLLVTATDDALAKMHYQRSHAVVNDTVSATAEFIDNPDLVIKVGAMKNSIIDELGEGRADFIAAGELSEGLLGDPIATNLFLVGYAYQKGLLPVSAKAIHRALELNGVRVEFNQQAFNWGRRAFLNLNEVEQASGVLAKRFTPLEQVNDIVEHRVTELTAYQNEAYAEQYKSVIDKVMVAETAVLSKPNDELILTKAVAKALYKTMAIKDEYEVARLFTDGRFEAQLKETFEGSPKLSFNLAPPLLSQMLSKKGSPRKFEFGSTMFSAFKLLAKLKGLRGGTFDVFSYTAERKLEVTLIDELNLTIDLLLASLNSQNKQLATEIVELYLGVRGYGHVKEKNYHQYRLRLKQQLSRYAEPTSPLKAINVEVANVA
ncbi:MAG: indolepyruvate ferredoxin oxidoreductase [Paracoccaceae bacterium]|jgi:indolepyruvate ferredoxin oxidoreductase